MNKKIYIIVVSEQGISVAKKIALSVNAEGVFSKAGYEGSRKKEQMDLFVKSVFNSDNALVFIGAMGICVRYIAPYITDKHIDPAVVNVDTSGRFVVSVLSGHIGGANELSLLIAGALGAMPVISTNSDISGLWALDLFPRRFKWNYECSGSDMNSIIAGFVNKNKTALLLDVRDEGTEFIEQSLPEHVKMVSAHELPLLKENGYSLLIGVTHKIYETDIPSLFFRPGVLHLGIGCRKNCDCQGVSYLIDSILVENKVSRLAVASISTIDIKKDEPLINYLAEYYNTGVPIIYDADTLSSVKTANPSERVKEETGTQSVCEAAAILSSGGSALLIEKYKGSISKGNEFTVAVAVDMKSERKGRIEIVGAGPGDPELISVRGKKLLERADLVLYAGSLVPYELTKYAPAGALIKSSADMTLEEQLSMMKEYYFRNKFIVRLHTGDPSIYGAIQEQMAFFDENGMDYRITPGISSFLAAAAALKSQFTIPEEVQTVILTRSGGRTITSEREKISKLAESQSTMCIFLSASMADDLQAELLIHYSPDTPVAVCHKLTWSDEKIVRGKLENLASIVRDNNFTLTTMIVVGNAIGNRKGLSRLYSGDFKHLFRE